MLLCRPLKTGITSVLCAHKLQSLRTMKNTFRSFRVADVSMCVRRGKNTLRAEQIGRNLIMSLTGVGGEGGVYRRGNNRRKTLVNLYRAHTTDSCLGASVSAFVYCIFNTIRLRGKNFRIPEKSVRQKRVVRYLRPPKKKPHKKTIT